MICTLRAVIIACFVYSEKLFEIIFEIFTNFKLSHRVKFVIGILIDEFGCHALKRPDCDWRGSSDDVDNAYVK